MKIMLPIFSSTITSKVHHEFKYISNKFLYVIKKQKYILSGMNFVSKNKQKNR